MAEISQIENQELGGGIPPEIRSAQEEVVQEASRSLSANLRQTITPERFKRGKRGSCLSGALKTILAERVFYDRWGKRRRYKEARLGLKALCGGNNGIISDVLGKVKEEFLEDESLSKEQRENLLKALSYLEKLNEREKQGYNLAKQQVKSELSLILSADFPENLIPPERKEEILKIRLQYGEATIRLKQAENEGNIEEIRKERRARNLLLANLVRDYTRQVIQGKRKGVLPPEAMVIIKEQMRMEKNRELKEIISRRRWTIKEQILTRIGTLFPGKPKQETEKTLNLVKRRFLAGLLSGILALMAVTSNKEFRVEKAPTPIVREALAIEEPRFPTGGRLQPRPENEDFLSTSIPAASELSVQEEAEQGEVSLEERRVVINQLKESIGEEWEKVRDLTKIALEVSDRFFLKVGGQNVTPAFGEYNSVCGMRTKAGKEIKRMVEENKGNINDPNVAEQIKNTIFQFAKASPEEMQKEIDRRLKAQGIERFATVEDAKQWLQEEGFMIDCSGAVCDVLDNFMKRCVGRGFYEETGTKWGYVGPGTFTELGKKGKLLSVPDEIDKIRPGDIIVLCKNVHSMVVLGFQVNEDTGEAVLLIAQSTDVLRERNGYHVIAVKITKPTGKLSEQDWSFGRLNVRVLFEGLLPEEEIQRLETLGLDYGHRFRNGTYAIYRVPFLNK